MAIVYRVQKDVPRKPIGRGPYVKAPRDQYSKLMDRFHKAPHIRPAPHNDGLDWPMDSEFFGFPNMRAFKNWFTLEDRKLLAKNGYKVVKYRVPGKYRRVSDSGRQCVFQRKGAVKIAEFDLIGV